MRLPTSRRPDSDDGRRRTEDGKAASSSVLCPPSSVVCLRPRPRRLRALLEALDLVLLDHGEPDVVEPVEQAMLAIRIDLEPHPASVRTPDLLLLQVDGQGRICPPLGIVEQLLEIVRRYLDRQDAVLEAIVVEDVAERGRDHATNAEIHQRP